MALKVCEVAERFQYGFLDEIGCTALGPQSRIDFLPGDEQQITAASIEHLPEGFLGAGLSGREPLCGVRRRFGHGSPPETVVRNPSLQLWTPQKIRHFL